MALGDKVRKAALRGRTVSAPLGVVVELVVKDGREWARVAAGKKQEMTSLWPVKQLEVVQ